jgi:hypothetical protein
MNPAPNQISIPIPNALTITINTSVPGYQTIKYKPNMTLQDIDKELTTIWFDPLVPLNQSVINKVPENIKVVEFFNKGLFRSLINAHGNQKPMTLEQAKRNKIIDNNIQLTLNVLFPTNGILYIKGEPYAIADVQWKKGDWKIDRKIKNIPEINVARISDPTTYNTIVKKDIQAGNEQLAKLPIDVIYGANFDPTNEEPSSIDTSTIKKKAEEDAKLKAATAAARLKAQTEADDRSKAQAAAKVADDKKKEARLKALEDALLKSQTPLAIENSQPAPPAGQLAIANGTPASTEQLAIDNGTPTPGVVAIDNGTPTPGVVAIEDVDDSSSTEDGSSGVEEIKNIQMSEDYKPTLKPSKSSNVLRSYFGNPKFYLMISMIFKYMTDEQKKFIQNIFKNTTNVEVKGSVNNISIAAYNFTVTGVKNTSSSGAVIRRAYTDGLRVISNDGGGNCLFIAVADAINYYNFNSNIDKKIIHNNYGNGNMIFTTKVLRNIVSTEIVKLFNSDENFRKTSIEEARINLHTLNDNFERIITTPDSMLMDDNAAYYRDNLLNVYKGSENFFVIIPDDIQAQNRNRPFRLVESNDDIIKYIESKYYWGDEKTINILNKKLNLNIIVIKNTDDKLTIPYPNIKSTDNNTWNKYLFLYNEENHYELITFDYLIKVNTKFVRLKKTIFNRGNNNIIPPFYIIFLLFSTFYIKLLPPEKDNVELFLIFFNAIQDSFNHIINAPVDSDINIPIFNKNFENYFGNFRQEIRGGAINNTTGSSSFLKKEDNQDDIQISFHITIDMELQKGKTLSKEQISNIKCIKGWNNVRKSYADFTGQKYVLPPVYENLSDKYNKKEDTDKKEEDNKKIDNSSTKKNVGGERKKRRKTRKKLNH